MLKACVAGAEALWLFLPSCAPPPIPSGCPDHPGPSCRFGRRARNDRRQPIYRERIDLALAQSGAARSA